MKNLVRFFYVPFSLINLAIIFSSFLFEKSTNLPYKHSGLTEREAAVHLLSRFTYGIKPGDIDNAISIGLDIWLQQQLDGKLNDKQLNNLLKPYDSINLSNTEIAETYPKNAKVLRMAIRDGVVDQDSIDKSDKKNYREKVLDYMKSKNIRPQQELFRQFISQKILRANYSENQLKEVMTDFWFNHFNVSLTKNDCAMYIPAYERDVIRPNVFGKFSNLLIATAKSPAMLFYLDNFSSSGSNEQMYNQMMAINPDNIKDEKRAATLKKLQSAKKNQGLNENYAREVMELHTLGVDGGYTQTDVTQAAKVLTGWTVYPFDDYGPGNSYKKIIEKVGIENLSKNGFVNDGDFMFVPNRHDTSEKLVLGTKFKAGVGYEEGVKLLDMLAHQKATANFISRKIAIRFVNDHPSQKLVDDMAKTFLTKDGDIRQVMITMVHSKEFWNKEALREKTKSPFELAISSLRALNATVMQPYQVYNWVNKMGQKMYSYQAPTGFPDKAQYWINTGALLNRMNFGLALASQKIPGVRIDLAKLNNNKEPESSDAALLAYSKIIMPERNLQESIKRLSPMIADPNLSQKIDEAANKAKPVDAMMNTEDDDMMMGGMNQNKSINKEKRAQTKSAYFGNNEMLAQVVGVIIGSPEFQKR